MVEQHPPVVTSHRLEPSRKFWSGEASSDPVARVPGHFTFSDAHLPDLEFLHGATMPPSGAQDIISRLEWVALNLQGDFVRPVQHWMVPKDIPGNSPGESGGVRVS